MRKILCTRCNKYRRRNIPVEHQKDYICSECLNKIRREERTVHCYYCGEIFIRRAYNAIKPHCHNCVGIYTSLAEQIGVTRQRAKQLVDEKIENYRSIGREIPRKEIVEIIKQERLSNALHN